MNLLILRHTPEPDKIVALAARRCYSSREAKAIDDTMPQEEIKRMLGLLHARNHMSPFEHVSFTFSVDGVSRALSHQLVRHRMASYSQESQRYVNYKGLERIPNIIPPNIIKNKEALVVYEEALETTLKAYKEILNLGIPPEDARYIFPNAIETKLVFTLNARSLFNFFEQRCCLKAQWEIRNLANKMLAAVREVAPLTFKNAGAPCTYEKNPYCREYDEDCPMGKNLSWD